MTLRPLALLVLLALPGAAHADQAAATACSARLSKDGQMFYNKVAPTVTASTDIREALQGVARPLVMDGILSRDAARTAAEAAGECLKHLR